MSKQIIKKLLSLAVIFSPLLAWAATPTLDIKGKIEPYTPSNPVVPTGTVSTFSGLIDRILGVLDKIVPLLIGVAVVVFLYGVVKFITAAGDETKRKEGKDAMIYGIIGLFVMVAVWGLVNVLIGTFTLDPGMPSIPKVR